MWRRLARTAAVGLLTVSLLATGLDPVSLALTFKDGRAKRGGGVVDKIFLAKQNPKVVDNFRFGIREAQAALDSNELEYAVDIGPVNGSTSANYVYASFFNPSGSGRTAVIKRIAVRANAVAAATYVNLSVRRTTAASAGTQITAANIPKKHNDSSNAVTEVRHTGATVTLAGVTDSRIMGQAMPGAAGQFHSIRDITFGSSDENIVLQPGEGIAVYQEAAGDADQRIRVYVEWEEVASAPSAQTEFLFAFPRVGNAAAANYVYNSFFNPAASGKTAIVKRIWFGSETCDAAAVYTNNIVLRRTSAASAGTAITASNVPKKHTGSANSVMEFRHTGVTVTAVGGSDARLGIVTPCAVAGQPHGWMTLNFEANDEQLILQAGQGIALMSDATGDANQLNRMIVEWQEVASGSTPASQGEYLWASSRVEVAAALNTNFFTFFNPSASGKTAVVKRIAIRNNADGAATYSAFNLRRVTAASGGTLITASDLPKKHTGTANAVTEVRWCGATCGTAISATYAGTTDSDLLQVNGPGAVGQIIGQREIAFSDNEKLVLQPGEGIGFYLDVLAGDVDQYVKMLIEWDEEASAPSSAGEYLADIGPINGSTATSYNYATLFNPAASGKTAVVKRVSIRVDTIAAAVYIPMQLRRISAASSGTLISAANVPKKHTGTANSAMEIRRTGVTATYAGTADSKLLGLQTPGAVGSAIAPAVTGYVEQLYKNDEQIILQPGEGIGLYHDTSAGDADFRVKLLIEWQEVASGSTPASEGEFMMTTGPVNGSTSANYVYTSLFNPSGSSKNYVVKRVGIKANRSGTLTAPGYIPVTIRRTTAASAGTQVTAANIPKKHSGTSDTTAEIRHTNVTVTLAGVTDSRLLGVTVPGVVNQASGDYDSEIVFGDELILKPGEGLALYQEATAGDALVRFRFLFEWSESAVGGGGSLTVDIVDSGGASVASPSMVMSTLSLAFTVQTSTGTFGVSSQKVRVTNTTATATWTLSVAASATTAVWDSVGTDYDFNDPTANAGDGGDTDTVGGQMTVNPSGATITPQSGCNTTGLTLGSSTAFNEGVTNSVTLLTAGASAGTNCYWDLTNVSISQTVPKEQPVASDYDINMVVSVVAS
ncbi:MAG: hypothetical protein HY420_00670 [Candidatus Kerfeldbacteria bacterium]|nr:hypothetical protein [Candidatus Kerfeldbacteria bacterium]